MSYYYKKPWQGGGGTKDYRVIEIFLKKIGFLAIDTFDLCQGLVTRWRSNVSLINAYSFVSSLCTSFEVKALGIYVSILKFYDDRHSYWDKLFGLESLKQDFVIIGAYLNYTWSIPEVWVILERVDRLGDYFICNLNKYVFLFEESFTENPLNTSP
jgi:hypothetical protein